MMLLPLLPLSVPAADVRQQEQQAGDSPAVEFLEFLGEWETGEGVWIDPEEMDDDYLAGQLEGTVHVSDDE